MKCVYSVMIVFPPSWSLEMISLAMGSTHEVKEQSWVLKNLIWSSVYSVIHMTWVTAHRRPSWESHRSSTTNTMTSDTCDRTFIFLKYQTCPYVSHHEYNVISNWDKSMCSFYDVISLISPLSEFCSGCWLSSYSIRFVTRGRFWRCMALDLGSGLKKTWRIQWQGLWVMKSQFRFTQNPDNECVSHEEDLIQ